MRRGVRALRRGDKRHVPTSSHTSQLHGARLGKPRRFALQLTKRLMPDERHHACGFYAESSGRKRRRDLVYEPLQLAVLIP